MEEEIANQIQDLPLLARTLGRPRPVKPSEIVFTGSGDSFASSLFAHYLSNGEVRVADSYEIQLHPSVVKNKTLLITSISGRTRANIQLARQVKGIARKRIAVTANPASPLARECDEVQGLSYRSSGTLTAGTISFTASLMALASRIKHLPSLDGLGQLESRADQWARQQKIWTRGAFLFVGSGIGYAIAAYGAFKIQEVLGISADYYHTEQVGHSRLFAIRDIDNIVCVSTIGDRKTDAVYKVLANNGFNANLLKTEYNDPVTSGLAAAFSLQHLALGLARKRGLRECAFVENRRLLKLSNHLIY